MSKNPVEYTTPNSLAAVWSMMLPGLGQLMKGRIMPGLFWSVLVAGGYYAFFWPGLILHACCILDAGFYKGDDTFLSLNTWQKRIGFLALIGGLIGYVYYRNIY
jgi:TM2 domain-containing membrane protein YozV